MTITDVIEIENYFLGAKLPTTPIKLDDSTTIESPADFVVGHLEHVRANMGKKNAQPYYERLVKLREIIGG